MSPLRRTKRRTALLTIAVLGLCSTGGDFREDEVQCDHAAAHLADCCWELGSSSLECGVDEGEGCGSYSEPPWLTVAESECIRARDCSEIASAKICERVEARIDEVRLWRAEHPAGSDNQWGTGAVLDIDELKAVCP